jgi:hypothetical protein
MVADGMTGEEVLTPMCGNTASRQRRMWWFFRRALKEERTIISVAFVKAIACPFSPGTGVTL